MTNKILSILAVPLFLALASCSEDEEMLPAPTPPDDEIELTCTAYTNGNDGGAGATTRAFTSEPVKGKTWDALDARFVKDEYLSVYYYGKLGYQKSQVKSVTANGNAKLTTRLSFKYLNKHMPGEKGEMTLIYPNVSAPTTTIDYTTQDGTLDDMMNHDYRWGKSTITKDNAGIYSAGNFTLRSTETSYLGFTCFFDGKPINVSSLALDADSVGTDWTSSLTFDNTTCQATSADNGPITIKPQTATTKRLYAVVPSVNSGRKVRMTVTDNNGQAYTLAFTLKVLPNHYKPLKVNLKKANIPQAVDLGLSVKWATYNVGASAPEGFGIYISWGETGPKAYYGWENYRYAKGSYTTLTKYCNRSDRGYNGFTDNLTVLQPMDDAATVHFGRPWRTPTKEEMDELVSKCKWTWTGGGKYGGYVITGPNGNTIFLPSVGYVWKESKYIRNAGAISYYRTASIDTDQPNRAWILRFDHKIRDYENPGRGNPRGVAVRAVRP